MPKFLEIERAFHLKNEDWRAQVSGDPILMRAVYLSRDPRRVIRVRYEHDTPTLTIKGKSNGPMRPEFNIPIDKEAADRIFRSPDMWDGSMIVKIRWSVLYLGQLFTVDVFESPRRGYQRVEIETQTQDTQVVLPDWVGEEITDKFEHSNSAIAGEAPSLWDISRLIDEFS